MLHFCTLFDSVYLSRGMAMYESLQKHFTSFHLYIFAFDDACYQFFIKRHFPNITVISLQDFEDDKLLTIKPTRSRGEYCWTCTPATILYVLDNFHVDSCTYLDADLYFFSSPQVLLDEVGDNSVLLTEHRYTAKYDQSATSGKYCVQFVFFKNDLKGRAALIWWRNACLEWCYNRQEDGKFGDQKYLDDWLTRFEGVHELQHLGGGVAPWNMQQYTFEEENGKVYGTELCTKKKFEVIFFHFHALSFVSNRYFSPTDYDKNDNSVFKYILRPYVRNILNIRRRNIQIAQNEHYFSFRKKLKYAIHIIYYRLWSEICCLWYINKSKI